MRQMRSSIGCRLYLRTCGCIRRIVAMRIIRGMSTRAAMSTTHEKKTHITPLSDGFLWLGFQYRITNTGKIIMTLNSANVKHERKKLRRLVNLAKRGEITKAKADECYRSWKAHASKGNSYKLIKRMDAYYAELWR